MDIINFPKQKEKGLVSIKRYGQHFQISVAQFDPLLGEVLPPITQTVTREQYQQDRDSCAARLAAYDAVLAEMDALASGA